MLLSAGLFDIRGFAPPPKIDPPAGVIELAGAFPKAEVVAEAADGIGLGFNPPPKIDPVAGGFGGFAAFPKIDGVVPAGVVFEVVANPPPVGAAVVVVAEVLAVFPKRPAPPPKRPPPAADVFEDVAGAPVFPNMLPPVAGALGVVVPNAPPPAGLAMVYDFRVKAGQR